MSNADAPGPCLSAPELLSLAARSLESESIQCITGDSVTVRRVVSDPEAKRALGQEHSAIAVDMESYWIARIALTRGVPFLSIRAISDTVHDSLPPFEKFIRRDGTMQRGKAELYYLSHPRQMVNRFRLNRNTTRAIGSLTAALDCLIASF
ncbi:MAG: hypothetical protein NTU41_02805 [Chloroflexi bacterium]|nr:hypothetical protein [Chloroflexota bacterium]